MSPTMLYEPNANNSILQGLYGTKNGLQAQFSKTTV